MILKYYEFGKINTENSKFILLYGKNEGLKNEKISELILFLFYDYRIHEKYALSPF